MSGKKKILFLRRILAGSRHETVEMIGGKNRNGWLKGRSKIAPKVGRLYMEKKKGIPLVNKNSVGVAMAELDEEIVVLN